MNKKLMVLLLITALLISGCQNGGAKTTVKIAMNRDEAFSMTYLLFVREKFLANHLPEGVTVEWSTITNNADQRDALVSGKIDMGAIPVSAFITARENGIPIVPLSFYSTGRPGVYTTSDRINTIDDITADDKIAITNIVGTSYTAFMMMSKDLYGDARKFDDNMTEMDMPEIFASMRTGDDIAAVLLTFPDTEKAAEQGFKLILDYQEYGKEISSGLVATTTETFAKNNPLFIDAFNAAFDDTVKYIDENPQEAFEFLSGYVMVEPDVLQNEYEKNRPETRISESGYDRLAAFMYEIGLLDNEPQKFRDIPNYDTIPKTD